MNERTFRIVFFAVWMEGPAQCNGSNLLEFLGSSDSLLEVQVLPVLRGYIASGGQPQVAVARVVQGYRGTAQLCNLHCAWLDTLGGSGQTADQLVTQALASLVVKRFDPKRADAVFERDHTVPRWLDAMIAHPEWRSLLYRLAETYRNCCLLLNFAIQVIISSIPFLMAQRISDAGYQTEIAALATASTYYGVFNRVLKDSLAKFIQLDEISLPPILEDFKVFHLTIDVNKQENVYSQPTHVPVYSRIDSITARTPQRLQLEKAFTRIGVGCIERVSVTPLITVDTLTSVARFLNG